MSYNLLAILRGSAGYYNALSNPVIKQFVQTSYDKHDAFYVVAMYPVINFEHLAEYESRKSSELAVKAIQKHGSAGLPAIAQARYLRRFDFPSEINLACHDSHLDEDGPERTQSARALYEYACGDVNTLPLDKKQICVLESGERYPSQPPLLLTIEPLWLIAFPSQGQLYQAPERHT